jgi:hypothetical protein
MISLFSYLGLLSILICSCNKYTVTDNAHQLGISRITYFATLNMAGSPYMSVVMDSTFTDPGVTATQNGASLTVTVSGTVNTSVVGLYTINYSAVNSDGYPASTTRTVAVLPAPEMPGLDLSGSYYYVNTGANNSTIVKLAPGFYSTTNCWSPATTIPCLFICVDGMNILMPDQATAYGALNGTGTLSATGALTYIVSIPSQGLNNVPRHWHLQ